MKTTISNQDDVIDSRSIIERIEELEGEMTPHAIETETTPADTDYPTEYRYEIPGGDGACVVKSIWADRPNPSDTKDSVWLESNDGQRVCVPFSVRGLVAKRIREAMFRK